MESNKLELVFTVEKDTKNTRRYKEKATDGPPVIPACGRQGHALRPAMGTAQVHRRQAPWACASDGDC